MSYTIFTLLGLLIIAPILIAYYQDYKADPKEFSLSTKALGKGLLKVLIYILIYFGANQAYERLVPFNKNHGMGYNAERENLGLPPLKADWAINEQESDQFKTYWWKTEPRTGHFKKVIEYDMFNCKTETDYYRSKTTKETTAWSEYDYEKNKFEYFIETPNIDEIVRWKLAFGFCKLGTFGIIYSHFTNQIIVYRVSSHQNLVLFGTKF